MTKTTRSALLLLALLGAACSKGKGGPDISEADKTAKPTEQQCGAFAAKTIEIGANPESMRTHIRDQCLQHSSVALVKCIEPATKTADLGDCLEKYPNK
ncbi:MAG: hypothetical protein KF773_23215 [Deltaproteobacteria bacterium]|nr:hypothetical protein [Deltaproteobacteria bacterium]MCW5806023.1 hypothetical protein [Deltaproteobacteria bacterium]